MFSKYNWKVLLNMKTRKDLLAFNSTSAHSGYCCEKFKIAVNST
ncbi:uncharacterized protein METZ01_LOCUS432422 [marine metagenome]|uniref:Uncharacterized protein n=1 Tax=marine metagenome TaxID=408172 RepID=A0A382YAM4_9ZZZZ